jgi:cytohesin
MKLLSLGASVHSTNNLGETALHLAITNGYTYCARILVDAGASVFARTAELETPLHRAAMQPAVFPEVLEFLINGDFDIDVLDDVGITPLSIASRFNNLPGVRALLECGADVNLANVNGNTPLISAVSHNALETSTYLCSRGADLTVVNIWGYNIFHQIAYGAGIEIIDVLKDVDLTGVDSDLSDEEGITPIEAFIRWRDTNFSGKRGDRDEELAAFRYLLDKARLSRPCCTAFIGPKEKQE